MKYLLFMILLVAIIITAGCVQQSPATSKITPVPTEAKCNVSVVIFGPDSCNSICYDWQTQMCCGGTIYNAKTSENVCCGGKLYQRQGGWECCPNTDTKRWINASVDNSQIWFNTSTHHCCAGKLTPGPNGWYNSHKQWQDCGNSCYDTQTQSCCINVISPGGPNVPAVIIMNVRQGKSSCCKDRTIPEDMRCNPETGSVTLKGSSGSDCPPGYDPYSCYQRNKQYSPPYGNI
jgi:hypothetical protein